MQKVMQMLGDDTEELDLFKLAYKSAAAGIAVADLQGKVRKANPAFVEMWGYDDEDDVVDRPVTEFHSDPEQANSVATDVVENGEWEGEILAEKKDGTTFPVRASASLVTTERGEPAYIMSSFVDISERVAREQELVSKTRAIEAAPIGVSIADAQQDDMPLTYVNKEFEETTGYAAEEVLGRNCRFLQGEQTDAEPVSAMRDAIDAGESVTVELRNYRKDGEQFWNRVSIAPVRTEDGISQFVGFQEDITERKERDRELQRQNSRLNEFANVISHDLRNPLNVAQARATMLQEQCDDEVQEHLSPLVSALTRMEDIIEDTLTLARQGETIDETSAIPVTNLVGKCWDMVETQTATLEIDDEFTVQGDRDRLRHVFENLFRNAVEHGGDDVTIRVGRAGEDCIYVEDDGPGIPAADRDEIFEPGHTSASGGTGFGLTIVKRIAEAHGWEVAVTEARDGGARFEFNAVRLIDE